MRSSTERYNWNKALEAASLPPVTIHSARHWTASMTARANMPDDARTAIMGHTSITMTNHYTHRDGHIQRLAALISISGETGSHPRTWRRHGGRDVDIGRAGHRGNWGK